MKLSNIKKLGRFINTETNTAVNVYQGRNMARGTDHLFYYFRQRRQPVSMADFYGGKWKETNQ
jgi:hypothetical protein